MYRQLEESSSEPEQHQAPGKSNRQRAALKREKPAGKPEIGAVETTTAFHLLGRPVTNAGRTETPL